MKQETHYRLRLYDAEDNLLHEIVTNSRNYEGSLVAEIERLTKDCLCTDAEKLAFVAEVNAQAEREDKIIAEMEC